MVTGLDRNCAECENSRLAVQLCAAGPVSAPARNQPIGSDAFNEAFRKLESIQSQFEAKLKQFSQAIKDQTAAGHQTQPNETVRRLQEEASALQREFSRELDRVQKSLGISEDEFAAYERAREAQLLPNLEARYWRAEIEKVEPDQSLDDLLPEALPRLLQLVDPAWLREQAGKRYRLDAGYLTAPLHLVNGVRVGAHVDDQDCPQRFAHMLLICQDHLEKRWDLDFFAAAQFVPEIAQLGSRLDEIGSLGPEADRKLRALTAQTDRDVSATVYELLVGAACTRKGMAVTMLPENRARKVPDYRVDGIGPITGAIECKRRLGLTVYELAEAKRVEDLYDAVRAIIKDAHCSVEVAFSVPVQLVPRSAFVECVRAAMSARESVRVEWGSVRVTNLPFRRSIDATRLYSPDFLMQVFDWSTLQHEWDGIVCEVDPPSNIGVEIFSSPACLKWRSESEEALTKKARGISSLVASAIQQIPDGDIGFAFIAYPEGSRSVVADARTKHILESLQVFWHRWSVRAPMIVVNRLYARALHMGLPDLIENVLPAVMEGEEFWLTTLPTRVFTG